MTDFDAIYRGYRRQIYRFCLARVTDPHAAEELTAEIFASAYAAYERLVVDDATAIAPWLVRIARNAVIDHHRRRGRRQAIADRFPLADDRLESVERHVLAREDIRMLGRCLAALSDRDRRLIALRLSGASGADVGELLGLSAHAATVASGRALSRLRVEFGRRA
ncbi:RNA polymerase sigma factor [Fodinicola acaciae]|uniref:RNA polymerase sigma factor n=1 Tax=Fodinicola acaciae TaxID=2681555 RepID=UPI0013D638DF|nr:sigma-70 family RNA polymerase sigma factor [Fodinicola acaciae]